MRRFEFKEGNSSKFWEVSVSGNTLTVRFGRIGSEGQEKTKTFASAALAEKEQDKLVAEKQGKGYKEVGAPSAEKVVSAPSAQKAAPAPPSGTPARPAASKPADGILADLRASKPLKEAESKIEALQRASIRLIGAPSNKAGIGKSKLGGQPDFPAGMNWPLATVAGNEIALPFVAQLNLADLHPFDVEGLLPGSGMLYFFYNSFDYGADYLAPANWRVLFHSGANGAFTSTAPPMPIRPHLLYDACALKFQSEVTLPCVETCYIGAEGDANARVELTEEEWDAYAQLLNELRANKNIHQMLGYSDDVQPYAMENGYDNVRDRFFPGSSPFSSLDNSKKYKEYFQGRLLLQISEEKSIKMQFGRGGRLFFFIRKQDLKVRDFSKVWVTEQ